MLGASKQNALGRRNTGSPGNPGAPGGFALPENSYVAVDYIKEDYVQDTE